VLSGDLYVLCGEKHAPANEIIKRGHTALARTRKTTLRVTCSLERHLIGPHFIPDCQLGVGAVHLLPFEGDSDVRDFHEVFIGFSMRFLTSGAMGSA